MLSLSTAWLIIDTVRLNANSWGAVSRGQLLVFDCASFNPDPNTRWLKWTEKLRGLKILPAEFHPLVWFCNSPKQEVAETWSLGESVLCNCITASEGKNANHNEETCDDTIEQINRSKMPQKFEQHPLFCFSSSKHHATAGLHCHGSAQQDGFVPILSSWVDEMRKMKQLSITIQDGGSAFDRVSHLKL